MTTDADTWVSPGWRERLARDLGIPPRVARAALLAVDARSEAEAENWLREGNVDLATFQRVLDWVRKDPSTQPSPVGGVELMKGHPTTPATSHVLSLPPGYDDATQRGKLIKLAHERLGDGDWRVQSLVRDPSNGCLTARLTCSYSPLLWGSGRGLKDQPYVPRDAASIAAVLARMGLPDARDDDPAARENVTLWRFAPHTREFVAGHLPPYDRDLRDRVAAHLGCDPWELEIDALWSPSDAGDCAIRELRVLRSKLIPDPAVRRKTWQRVVDDLLPVTPGASWRVLDDGGGGRITVRRLHDPLEDSFKLAEFDARYRVAGASDPAESWASFPVAVRESGEAVVYQLFHSLIVGQTGAGKGSVLWAIMSGLLPAARDGLVEFYAIDPKNAEAKAARGIFEEIATSPDEWASLLERLVEDLHVRQKRSGRSFAISTKTPLRVLMIDEMSALSILDTDGKRAKQVMANLVVLLSQGRSDGVIVLGAVQAPQKEMVGPARMYFAMRVALRTETAVETDLVLGDRATEDGAGAHLIPPANPGNHYRTAGTGYMRLEGEARPVRVRFPYTDDETLERWSVEFAALRRERRKAAESEPAVRDVGDLEVSLDDLEEAVDSEDDIWRDS